MKKNIDSSYARIVDTPAILKSLLLISLFSSLAVSFLYWLGNGIQETSLSLLGLAIVSGFLILVMNWGYTQIAGLVLYLVVSIVLTLNISIGHAIFDEAMLAYPLLIVFSGLLFGKRSGVVVTGITAAQVALIYILAQSGHIQPFGGAVEVNLEETITTTLILLSTGLVTWVVIDIIETAVGKIYQSEQDLENAFELTLGAWAKALEIRRREDPGHCERVVDLTTEFAIYYGLDSDTVKQIRNGAYLHDIGKMGIPEHILLKSGMLDEEEKSLIKKHTLLGQEIVKDIDHLEGAAEVVVSHHERYDGAGYPLGLKWTQIPILAQIFAIVDCWDVLQTERPCRPSWEMSEIWSYIKDQSGGKFQPSVVDAFIDFIADRGGEVIR